MRNICKNKQEFFKTIIQHLIDNGNVEDELKYKSASEVPENKYIPIINRYLSEIVTSIKGWKNIEVDFENIGKGGEFRNGGLNGLFKFDSGEYVYGFDCGGDWEAPVNAIIYVEDNQVKFYVPERGNVYCITEFCAWGSQHCERDRVYNDEETDMFLELEDIKDYFHNRNEQQHSENPCGGIVNDNYDEDEWEDCDEDEWEDWDEEDEDEFDEVEDDWEE